MGSELQAPDHHVDWFGPYTSVEEAAAAAKEDFEDGLYLVAGKRKSQHGKPCLQYVGIAKRLATRLFTSKVSSR